MTQCQRISLAATVLAIAALPGAFAQFVDDFESPTYEASPVGVALDGQNGFYRPPIGGLDGRCFEYADNALGVVANPAGAAQFIALTRGATQFARVQRDIAWNDLCWTVQLDINLLFIGTLPTNNIAASLTIQPYPGEGSLNVVFRWDDPHAADSYSVYLIGYGSDGQQPYAGGLPIDNPAFQGLLANRWYRFAYRVEFAANKVSGMSIRDLTGGGPRVSVQPEDDEGYYLGGGTDRGGVLPTAFRIFAGGGFEFDFVAGNTIAVDNLGILALASECPGDVDDDGDVDLTDLAILLAHFGQSTGGTHNDGDAQCDGDVDLPDLAILLINFGTICGDA